MDSALGIDIPERGELNGSTRSSSCRALWVDRPVHKAGQHARQAAGLRSAAFRLFDPLSYVRALLGLSCHSDAPGSTSAMCLRIADEGGIEQSDASVLHQRTHALDPLWTFALSETNDRCGFFLLTIDSSHLIDRSDGSTPGSRRSTHWCNGRDPRPD
jgi:hypothetical protein